MTTNRIVLDNEVSVTFEAGTSPVVGGAATDSPLRGKAMGTEPVEQVALHFDEVMRVVESVAASAADKVVQRGRSRGLSEVQLQFGVKFDVTAGVIFAQGSAGAHLQVSLTWKVT
jgi:hypothetical protein